MLLPVYILPRLQLEKEHADTHRTVFFFLIFHQKELFGECLHVSTIVLLNKDEHIADPLKTSNKCSLQTFGRGTFLLRI